jgi:hypothetical protein
VLGSVDLADLEGIADFLLGVRIFVEADCDNEHEQDEQYFLDRRRFSPAEGKNSTARFFHQPGARRGLTSFDRNIWHRPCQYKKAP